VLLQQNNNAACVQEVIRGPKKTKLTCVQSSFEVSKTTPRAFQVVIRDPKDNAACVQEIIEVPKKTTLRAFKKKLIRDPQKKQRRVPSGNNWTSQQTTKGHVQVVIRGPQKTKAA